MGKLFGSSGVRGLANVDLTPILACKVASAVATHAKAKKAVVAKDTRVSGDMIEDALVSGLLSCGVDVLLAGYGADSCLCLRHQSLWCRCWFYAYSFP